MANGWGGVVRLQLLCAEPEDVPDSPNGLTSNSNGSYMYDANGNTLAVASGKQTQASLKIG
jgi:hypothetical protein